MKTVVDLLSCRSRFDRYISKNWTLSAITALAITVAFGFPCNIAAKPFQVAETGTEFTAPRCDIEITSRQPMRLAMASRRSTAVEISSTDPDDDLFTICNGIRNQDEILLISSRPVGCSCDPETLQTGLLCKKYCSASDGCCRQWKTADLMTELTASDSGIPTVVYVHGNRVSSGLGRGRGLAVYRRMIRCATGNRPIRFILFSWPASKIQGPLRDIQVKASRTRPVAFQLAWVLNQISSDTPIGVIGYSFGARIATGALHILGGGDLNGLALKEPRGPAGHPMSAIIIAAATHAHWLGSGQYHGQALCMVDRFLSVNNCNDAAMKWYHLSTKHGKPQAMGLRGPCCLGPEGRKVCNRNVARYVGSSHEFHRYFSTPGIGSSLWKFATPEK